MGVVLHFGMTAKDLMLSAFAKAEDPNSGGRQMPGHFGQKKNRIVTGSSPVTTQVTTCSWCSTCWQKWRRKISLHLLHLVKVLPTKEISMKDANFAGVHKLPVIIMV